MGNETTQSTRVSQAQGMVSAQVGCSLRDALVLLKRRADDSKATVDEVAALVLDRTIRFGE
jgi:AmiR/NasT family two-component response regulator